jgi:hypothetical protein
MAVLVDSATLNSKLMSRPRLPLSSRAKRSTVALADLTSAPRDPAVVTAEVSVVAVEAIAEVSVAAVEAIAEVSVVDAVATATVEIVEIVEVSVVAVEAIAEVSVVAVVAIAEGSVVETVTATDEWSLN